MTYLSFDLILIAIVLIVIVGALYKRVKVLEERAEILKSEKEEAEKLGEGLKEYVLRMQKRKEERKRQILELLEKKKKITNNDVERTLKISDATATNYLDELEKEGKIVQVGKRGRFVFYQLKSTRING